MKDPKVVKLVTKLKDNISKLNDITEKLKEEGCYFQLESVSNTNNKSFAINHFRQSIDYSEELDIEGKK
jgi:hypothetical protein|tara:strand:- start:371 stop:577 length:207 start_codon:yes stop_codon:yes gene_type:complete